MEEELECLNGVHSVTTCVCYHKLLLTPGLADAQAGFTQFVDVWHIAHPNLESDRASQEKFAV